MQPVFRQILAQAESNPDKAAILDGIRRISYGGLAASVSAVASGLTNRFNVRAGDRVVLLARSHADFVCTYLAVHCLGAINVPLDPQISSKRLADIVARVTPRIVIAESPTSIKLDNAIGFTDLANKAETSAVVATAENIEATTADILFTTGTTGSSKGVVLSHRALSVAAAHINKFIGIRQHSVEVLPLPLSHSFGLGRVRCVLSKGATLVLIPGFVSAARIFSALADHAATGFSSVPTGFAILLGGDDVTLGEFAGQLDYVEIGSSSMPLAQKKRLMQLLPETRICMHYGLTEASRSAYLSFHDDQDRLDSIGKPSPDVEMRIVDESGRVVTDGRDGHIEICGGHLMTEYWQDPEQTSATLRDGWLRTGDLGRRDAEGYYYLKARSTDVINVGGRKVLPNEIEEILVLHPAVAECACVGVPDPQGMSEEIISAFLVAEPAVGTRPKFSELAKLLRQSLESYKIPRRFTWVDELPKSSSGKILRRYLRNPDE
jgi:long-chain acyl-CoA synthetase